MRPWMLLLASGSDESIECKKPNTGYWSIVRKRRYRFSWPRREASEALSASGWGIGRKKTALQDKKDFFFFMKEKRSFFLPFMNKMDRTSTIFKSAIFRLQKYPQMLSQFLFLLFVEERGFINLLHCFIFYFPVCIKIENT